MHYKTVLEYIRDKKIQAYKIGRHWRIADPGWDIYMEGPGHDYSSIAFIRTTEVAMILGCSRRTVDLAAERGIIKYRSYGTIRTRYYSLSEILRWIDEKEKVVCKRTKRKYHTSHTRLTVLAWLKNEIMKRRPDSELGKPFEIPSPKDVGPLIVNRGKGKKPQLTVKLAPKPRPQPTSSEEDPQQP